MRFTTRMELPRTLNRTQTSHSIPQSLCVIIITQDNRRRAEKEEKQEWKEGHEGGTEWERDLWKEKKGEKNGMEMNHSLKDKTELK